MLKTLIAFNQGDIDLRPGMDQEPLCYLDEYIYSLIEADVQKYKALELVDND